MCEVGKKFVTKYNETIEVIEKLNSKKCVVKFLCNERIIETYNVSVKDGCSLKHEYTKSCAGIGMLGYIDPKKFPHTQKEKQLWKSLMKKYSSKGIECEEYCVFKDFCLKLRKLGDYDKLINNTRSRLVVKQDGEMIVEDAEFLKPVKRVHTKTGKTIYYDSLKNFAKTMGLNPRHVKEHYIKNGNIYRGYKIEFIES